MSKINRACPSRDEQSLNKKIVKHSVEEPPLKNFPNSKGKVTLPFVPQKTRYRNAKHSFTRNPIGYADHYPQQRPYNKFQMNHTGNSFPQTRHADIKRLEDKALNAVEALRVRGVDYMQDLEDNIEVHEESSRCFVQLPAELYDALQEDLLNPNEATLVYKAFQPLVGMVFGKRGNAATFLHQMGATLELANKDCFRIKCPRSQAQAVQEYFEGKLANILVRMNKDNVTVVMRPEKLMIMLSPFTLTPVVVLGLLSPHLLVLRIYDPQYEKIFADVHRDIQAFYGSLSTDKLMEHRLSLPITPSTLACFFDEKSCIFMRVVVEEVVEDDSPDGEMRVRIWKIDYGSFEWVSVNRLYRLQTCYLQVPRQCFVVRLLYAKKCSTSPLSALDIFMQYFSGNRFFALSVMEKPADLSHVILFTHRSISPSVDPELLPRLEDMTDIMDALVEHQIYQVSPYDGPDFSAEFNSLPLKTTIPYGQLCQDINRAKVSEDPPAITSSSSSQQTSPEVNLQDLVNPYAQHPEKRHIFKYRGLVLSDGERNLRMRTAPSFIERTNTVVTDTSSRALHNNPVNSTQASSTESSSSNQPPSLIDGSNSLPQSIMPFTIAPPVVNMPLLFPYYAPYSISPGMCFTGFQPLQIMANYPLQPNVGGTWAGIASSIPCTTQSSLYDPYTYVPYASDLL